MLRFIAFFGLVLGLSAAIGASGCKKKEDAPADDGTAELRPPLKKGKGPDTVRDPIKAPYDGMLKGRVVYKGTPPVMATIDAMNKDEHKGCLLTPDESDKKQQTWIVGKDNGVANVLIMLTPVDPKKTFFFLTKKDMEAALHDEAGKKWDRRKAILDQPFCAFHPASIAFCLKYIDEDGKKLADSGQQFIVKNSAKLPHNSNIQWNQRFNGTPLNVTLSPGEERTVAVNPQPDKIGISCQIHPWMSASAWSLDNPFYAVTDKDGYFMIPNVPTGVEVNLVGWHEGTNFFLEGGKNGVKRTFKKGENTESLEIAAK